MKLTATIQARPGEMEDRPSRGRVEELADQLRQCGFEVLRSGRFGVSVQADQTTFERAFGFDPSSSFDSTRRIVSGELRELADLVEVATPPNLRVLTPATNTRR